MAKTKNKKNDYKRPSLRKRMGKFFCGSSKAGKDDNDDLPYGEQGIEDSPTRKDDNGHSTYRKKTAEDKNKDSSKDKKPKEIEIQVETDSTYREKQEVKNSNYLYPRRKPWKDDKKQDTSKDKEMIDFDVQVTPVDKETKSIDVQTQTKILTYDSQTETEKAYPEVANASVQVGEKKATLSKGVQAVVNTVTKEVQVPDRPKSPVTDTRVGVLNQWDNGQPLSNQPKGIPNLGNTCYMNSLLQVLSWTNCFGQKLALQMKERFRSLEPETATNVTAALLTLIIQTHNNEDSTINHDVPRKILREARKLNSQFMGHRQQDSYELFNTVISGIKDEFEKYQEERKSLPTDMRSDKPELTPILRLLQGHFVIIYTYETCGHVEITLQMFTSIPTPIPKPRPKADVKSNYYCQAQSWTKKSQFKPETDVRGTDNDKTNFLNSDSCMIEETSPVFLNGTKGLDSEDNDEGKGCRVTSENVTGKRKKGEYITEKDGDTNGGNNQGDITTRENNQGDAATGNGDQGDTATQNSNQGDASTGESNQGDAATGNGDQGDTATQNSNQGDASTGESNQGDAATGNGNKGSNDGTLTCFRTLQKLNEEKATDLERGLQELTDIEEFDEELISCRVCNTDGRKKTLKKLLIVATPPVLVIEINKFKQEFSGVKKMDVEVTYPKRLNLAPYCSIAMQSLSGRHIAESGAWYTLYGVVSHSGSLEGGHYTAYVKTSPRPKRQFFTDSWTDPEQCADDILEFLKNGHEKQESDVWYHISDEWVTDSSEETATSDRNAYILLYEKDM